jgi:peroxiredoxin
MKNLVMIAMAAIFFACNPSKEDGTVVQGTLTNAAEKMVYLEKFENQMIVKMDSVKILPDGKFKLKAMGLKLDFYRLAIYPDQFAYLITDSTENISITGDGASLMKSAKISGSVNTELMRELDMKIIAMEGEMDSIARSASANPQDTSGRGAAFKIFTEKKENYTKFLRGFIDQHPSSPANLNALSKLSMKDDFEYFKKVRDGLKSSNIGNPQYVEYLDKQIVGYESQMAVENALAPGNMAPELTLNTPEGATVSLSSLKGKIVMIDFWASWCKPCRQENPNVVKIYNKYKNSGFEILGVSLDENKDKWVDAIKQDALPWPHISDLKGWQSAAAQVYGIQSIPFTVLVDKDGKIIDKNLRGELLENKLKEIFGV